MDKDSLKSNSDYFLSVCKGLEDLRRGNKEDIRQSQIKALEGGNKVVSDLNKYLFAVATLLVPIIFSFVTINEARERLTTTDSFLITLSIVFLLFSIGAGFSHMITEYLFFKKWLGNQDRKLKLWATVSFWPGAPLPEKIKDYIQEYNSIKARTEDIASEIEKEESPVIYLILQGVFWLIGVTPLIFIIFSKLP